MSLQESFEKLQENLSEFNLNEIDFNNVGMWPTAGKMVVWVAAFVVVLLALYQFNLKGLHEALLAAEKKEVSLREDFEKRVNEAANLEAYRTQMVEMEAAFEALLKQLPQDTEVPGLLDDISSKGLDSGLTFNKIDLKPERTEEYYIELPIEINVQGGYHDFGSFVSGISGLPRIVTLGDFSIRRAGQKSGSSGKAGADKSGDKESIAGGGSLDMTITAKTFRYRPKGE